MMHPRSRTAASLLAAAAAIFTLVGHSQDEAASDAASDASADAVTAELSSEVVATDEASTEDGSATTEAAAPAAAPVRPEPAEMAPRAAEALLTRVVRLDRQRLVAVGGRGHILRSEDGVQWQQVPVPVNGLLTSVHFATNKRGWAVGHDAAILNTVDGGKTWQLQHFQPDLGKALLDVLFIDPQRGFAVGAYGLFLETRDGGQSWTPVTAAIVEEQLHFNALVKLKNGHLLVVGEVGMLALSEDQGVSWQRLESPYESSLFAALPDGEHGAVVAGLRGNVFRTEDVKSGNWMPVDLGTKQSVFGLARLPGGDVAAVGLNAMARRITRDNRVIPIQLDLRAMAKTAEAAPAASARESAEQRLGTLSNAVFYHGSLITVGDSGVNRWPLR